MISSFITCIVKCTRHLCRSKLDTKSSDSNRRAGSHYVVNRVISAIRREANCSKTCLLIVASSASLTVDARGSSLSLSLFPLPGFAFCLCVVADLSRLDTVSIADAAAAAAAAASQTGVDGTSTDSWRSVVAARCCRRRLLSSVFVTPNNNNQRPNRDSLWHRPTCWSTVELDELSIVFYCYIFTQSGKTTHAIIVSENFH